jgi:hypothetical protein
LPGYTSGINLQQRQKIELKLMKKNAAIWFNEVCKTKQLTPEFFNIKINGNNRQNRKTRIHTCGTLQGTNYELPEDDTKMSKHVAGV